jgi:hypothetical protein
MGKPLANLKKVILVKIIKYFALTLTLSTSSLSQAAYITFDEIGMDRIFSQDSFGENPIDIRVGKTEELVFPDLLNINTSAKLYDLFGQHRHSYNTANAFFVDSLSWCGGGSGYYAGCGLWPGNSFVVDSYWSSTSYGAELLAHELGHNLGLGHVYNSSYLMNTYLSGGTFLASYDVDRIFSSNLVQQDSFGWFIDITPVLVVAEATKVPEPAIPGLMLSGLFAIYLRRSLKN